MARVPGGPFTMGADRGGELDEHPAHTVRLSDFDLDLTEVTNQAYGECVAVGVFRHPMLRVRPETGLYPTRLFDNRNSR